MLSNKNNFKSTVGKIFIINPKVYLLSSASANCSFNIILRKLCFLRFGWTHHFFQGTSHGHLCLWDGRVGNGCAWHIGQKGNVKRFILHYRVPLWVIDWDTVFRMGHSPTKTVHRMQCTAWIGECLNLKTLSQSMTHDDTDHHSIGLHELVRNV